MYLVIPSDKAEEGGAAIIEFIWLHENYIKVKNDLSNSEVGDVGRALQTAPLRIDHAPSHQATHYREHVPAGRPLL